MDFLASLLSAWKEVNAKFDGLCDLQDYQLKFTGQVIYLEHTLNDTFDDTLRRIYIQDGFRLPKVFLYNTAEQRDHTYLYNTVEGGAHTYLYNLAEYVDDIDFVVMVPNAILSAVDNDLIREVVERYRQAGKSYVLTGF